MKSIVVGYDGSDSAEREGQASGNGNYVPVCDGQDHTFNSFSGDRRRSDPDRDLSLPIGPGDEGHLKARLVGRIARALASSSQT